MRDHKPYRYVLEMDWDGYSIPNYSKQEAIDRYNNLKDNYPFYNNLQDLEGVKNVTVDFHIEHSTDWYDGCGGLSCQATISGWIPMTEKEIEAEKVRKEKQKLAAIKKKEKLAAKREKELEQQRSNLLKQVKTLAKKDPSILEELKELNDEA